ncbi:MAG: T9SS type A sorting domain-containing protein [Dysgonamonadaceae bacterium]|nr:T9SS type A sorting domain-containing protein [Dysgonamonadaceae bacterium]
MANGGSNQPNGGAIQVDKTTGVSFKNCLFKNNESAKGGVFYIQDTQNPSVELRFESCSFIGNKSTQGGASCSGLFFRLVSEGPTINIINCTFSGNSNAGNGGTVYVYGAPASATFNIINTTIVDNIGTSGGGSGAGINVESQSDEARKAVMNIRNSIIEGNAVASGATAEDLALGYEPTSNKLQISNSFIGKVFVFGAGLVPAESYTNSALYWDYMTRSFDRNEIQSGIDAFNGNYNVYPLTAGSPALTYGNASFLQNIGISTDAIGRTRSFADGKCSVGAMEGAGIPAGIQPVELQSNIQLYQEDNLLILKSLKSLNSLELINLSGQIIAKKSGNAETLTLPVDYLQGVYIARIVSGNKVYTQKIIIK